MPVMSGLQATKEIKKIDNNIVVIVITADTQPKTMEEGKELGALTLLRKSTKKEDVLDALTRARELEGNREKK